MIGLLVGLSAGFAAGWLLGLWRLRRVVARIRKPLIAARIVDRHLQPELPRRVRREQARRKARTG